MTDAVYSDPSSASSRSQITKAVLRWLLYVLLFVFALFYLAPLFVMVTTSLKSLEEIRTGDLIALPREVTFDAWRTAWSSACTGIQCEGVRPYFWNSVLIAVPAVMISTLLGAINGYVVAQWRFRGANIFFALMLFGCFIPFQVVLLPMARVLGLMGIAGTIPGLIFVHVIYGLGFTTLFFRNYYVTIPSELTKAAKVDGANKWQTMINVVVPHLMPLVSFVTLMLLMDNFRVFEPIVSYQAEAHAQSLSTFILSDLREAGNPLYASAGATSILTIIGVAILLSPVVVRTWRDFSAKSH